jgi:hypothetical protein
MTLPPAPAFLIQQTYRGRDELAPIADARIDDGRTPPGLFLDFGAVYLEGVRAHGKAVGKLTPVLCGSAKHIAEKRTKTLAPWVGCKPPGNRTEWDKAIREALDEQRTKLQLDALTVPGADFSPVGYPTGLERQIDGIRRAWSKRPSDDPPWLAHFSLHDDWLKDASLRRFALNLITDLPAAIGIALQVRFSRRDRSTDQNTLVALREMIKALADDNRRVLLVKAGGLGWLSLAWGAWGFTAGRSQGSWVDSREKISRRKGQPTPPPVERYFEPQLLHHVLYPDHHRLAAQTGFKQCPCKFCTGMGSTWNAKKAAQHDLYALSEVTQKVAGGDRTARREAVLSLVEDAQTNWANWKNTTGLSPRSEPGHLSIWRSLV